MKLIDNITKLIVDPRLDKETQYQIGIAVSLLDSSYTLVTWPHSQEFMDKEWFDQEAILALGQEEALGSSAYFIPTNRLKED